MGYSGTKSALLNVPKAPSNEVGPRRVRENTVSPAPVTTSLWLRESGVVSTLARALRALVRSRYQSVLSLWTRSVTLWATLRPSASPTFTSVGK